MSDVKGTAQNAKMIEIQMKAAAAYVEEALKAVRIAKDAIETGEDDVTQKLHELITLQRLLSTARDSANWTAVTWTEYRNARETN